jgi:thiol-disulfide isomerase/thioredoxin
MDIITEFLIRLTFRRKERNNAHFGRRHVCPLRRSDLRSPGMKRSAILFLSLLTISAVAGAEAPGGFRARQVAFQLIDDQGQPVVGADVGLDAKTGSHYAERAKSDGTQWLYHQHRRSDANGIVKMDHTTNRFGRVSIIARHEQRKITAFADVDPDKTKLPIVLTLRPEQPVAGRVVCPELLREIKWLAVLVKFEGNRILTTVHDSANFELALPPGKYSLQVYGADTHHLQSMIEVKADANPVRLEPIALRATRLALIEGQPAPEIPDVVAWKNSAGLKLADLRGKCVILDFWGYWCSACVHDMPRLFELHDKYHGQGLEIIGIHIDKGESEQTPVTTVAELNKRLGHIRSEQWSGRDVPFPIALVLGTQTPFGEETDQKAQGAAAAAFGVIHYPTRILIDRSGRVVGEFDPNEEGMELLKQKLAESN